MNNGAVITDTGMNVCLQDWAQASAPLQNQSLPQSNLYQVMTLVGDCTLLSSAD